jgi:steroid 5-alpha reductase family enzyme
VLATLLVMVPVVAIVGWAFFRFSPPHGDGKAVLRFNVASLIVALVLGVAWGVRTYVVMSSTVDSPWWPIISALGALVIVPFVLGVAAVVRNVVLFRRRTEGSGQ